MIVALYDGAATTPWKEVDVMGYLLIIVIYVAMSMCVTARAT